MDEDLPLGWGAARIGAQCAMMVDDDRQTLASSAVVRPQSGSAPITMASGVAPTSAGVLRGATKAHKPTPFGLCEKIPIL